MLLSNFLIATWVFNSYPQSGLIRKHMKSIDRLMLESGYTKKELKTFKADCLYTGHEYKQSIVTFSKRSFYLILLYVFGFLIVMSFILGFNQRASISNLWIVLLIVYTPPLLFKGVRYMIRDSLFYIKYCRSKQRN